MLRVVFLQLFEQYEEGKAYNIERSLANGLCEKGMAVPFTVHQKMLKEAEQLANEVAEAAEVEKKRLAYKKKAAEDKAKVAELKEKKSLKAGNTSSKKVKNREMAVK